MKNLDDTQTTFVNSTNTYTTYTTYNMPIKTKIKYEVMIIRGKYIRIGLSSASCKKYMPVGSTKSSFAYSSKGYKLKNSVRKVYGETYTAGDVVGVEVNVVDKYVRFWKNGNDMGVAYWNLDKKIMFPSVSLYGECLVEVNYGKYHAFVRNNIEDLFVLWE
ncbi:hypothetical protein COBT_000398 [Conglomerata obtusa]